MKTLEERFWSKVTKTDGCWLFNGGKHKFGYGIIRDENSKNEVTHRIAWKLTYGDPGEMFVLHKCDNPPCVRPSHLFLGTQAENMEDMSTKGRGSKATHLKSYHSGEKNPRAKLSDYDIETILARRKEGQTLKNIAAEFEVTFQHISKIVNGHRRGGVYHS